jgi:glutathione S-transferase
MKPKLYIFAISHFSEKARFFLDRSQVEYETVYLQPVDHIAKVKEFAPESYVPVLRGEDFVHQGCEPIFDYAKTHGTIPSVDWDKEKDWIKRIDDSIGYPLQPIVYSYLLNSPEIVAKMFANEKGKPAVFENFGLIALGLKRRYKITDKNIEERKRQFAEGVQILNEAYTRSPFLVGDKLTGADITAVSLVAPIFQPKEHPNSSWFAEIQFPEPMKEWINSHKTGAYYKRVLEIYREFRN